MKKLLSVLLVSIFLCSAIFAEKGTVLDDRVRVRSTPSLTNSVIVGVVNKGDKLEVDAKSEELDNIDGLSEPWYRVKFDNKDCWIYGGYFSVNSNSNYLSEISRYSAMSDALFQYNAEFAANCGDYLRKGNNVTKENKSITVEGGFKINVVYYTFEYDSLLIDCYTRNGINFTWTCTSIVKDVKNPLNIKFNMTMEEVKAIFGDFDYIKANEAFIYGGGCRIEFIFDKNRLERINFMEDGC